MYCGKVKTTLSIRAIIAGKENRGITLAFFM